MLRSTRRQFCEHALLGAGACVAFVGAGGIGCHSHPARPTPEAPDAAPAFVPRTFTAASFATLSAVCERLLPRDEDPGAIDLGVPTYIDGMLASPELASVRELLLRVLPVLDRESAKRYGGKTFPQATPAEQDVIIDSWQHGRDGSQHFFDVILSLTLEGAFGDPKYGGNVGGRGFAMIGFTPDAPLKKMPTMSTMHHGSVPD